MTLDSTKDAEPLLVAAAKVSEIAAELGIKAVVIGAMALAHRGYPRATEDFDFGTYVDFHTKLRELAECLRGIGFEVKENAPDADDPIDGVLNIRDPSTPGLVQIVNFRTRPGRAVVTNAAKSGDANDPFVYVRLAELVALKLYAGSPSDKRDVEAVLEANPDADLEEIRSACRELELEDELEKLLARIG